MELFSSKSTNWHQISKTRNVNAVTFGYDGVSGFVNSSWCSAPIVKYDAKPHTILICYQRSPLGSKSPKLELRSWRNNHLLSEKYQPDEEMRKFKKERFGNFYRSDIFRHNDGYYRNNFLRCFNNVASDEHGGPVMPRLVRSSLHTRDSANKSVFLTSRLPCVRSSSGLPEHRTGRA